MQISSADIQNLMPDNGSSALVLKSGEQVTVDFVRKLEAGMFILNVNGKSIAASIDFDPSELQASSDGGQSQFPAVIIKTPNGIQLKIFEPLIQFAQTEQNSSSSNTQNTAQTLPQNSSASTASGQNISTQNIYAQPDMKPQTTQNLPSQPMTGQNLTAQSRQATETQNNQQISGQPDTTSATQSTITKTLPDNAAARQINQTAQTTQQAATQQTTTSQTSTDQTQPKLIGTAYIKPGDPHIIVNGGDQQIDLANIKITPQQAKTTSAQQTLGNARILAAVSESEDGTAMTLTLPEGSIEAADDEQTDVRILKVLENGRTLISVKDKLFEADLPTQIYKDLRAQVKINPQDIALIIDRQPVENLSQAYVKQQITGFNLESVLKAFGKFSKVSMEHMTADDVKTAIKNSGLFMENRLSKDADMSGDEKFRAFLSMDNPAKDSITRMQVTNLMMAGGMLAFLKTGDENVSDTFVRYKKGKNGNDTVYVSTQFSELGDTLIIIKPVSGTYNITIRTEKDISDDLTHLNLEKGSMHWYKLDKKDLDIMNPKNEITSAMGRFEVII